MEEEAFRAIMLKIESIPDEGYRSALIEAAILYRCKQELGHADPGGTLAMRLRREYAAQVL
jgi:hypothetical protein